MRTGKYKFAIFIELLLIVTLLYGRLLDHEEQRSAVSGAISLAETNTADGKKDYIKWVDFTVPCEALEYACQMDIQAHARGTQLDWITLLASTAAKWGGNFEKKALEQMKDSAQQALEEATDQKTATRIIKEGAADYKYFPYYREAYSAVLSGMLGSYRIQTADENGQLIWKEVYGLKAFSPIAQGFDYSDFDDFGASRSYGYARQHLGHDMMGQIGTPTKI